MLVCVLNPKLYKLSIILGYGEVYLCDGHMTIGQYYKHLHTTLVL